VQFLDFCLKSVNLSLDICDWGISKRAQAIERIPAFLAQSSFHCRKSFAQLL